MAFILLGPCSPKCGTLGAVIENAVQTRLAKQILAYFLRHPKGADDLKGVATWRLLDQMIHQTLAETRDALEWLVSEGYLVFDSTTGSERIFRLNNDKREEAEQFIETGSLQPQSDPKSPE